MNEIGKNRTSSTNAAIMVAAAGAVLTGPVAWPEPLPTYNTFSNSSYSGVTHWMRLPADNKPLAFEAEISKIYAALADAQQDLGDEFAAVWDVNLDALYEA